MLVYFKLAVVVNILDSRMLSRLFRAVLELWLLHEAH